MRHLMVGCLVGLLIILGIIVFHKAAKAQGDVHGESRHQERAVQYRPGTR